jgi:hypothetical protein
MGPSKRTRFLIAACTICIATVHLTSRAQSDQDCRLLKALQDIKSIGYAIGTYYVDNKHYPMVKSGEVTVLTSMLVPTYIRRLPEGDPWGNAYWWESDGKGTTCMVICFGADGKRDSSWNFNMVGTPQNDIVWVAPSDFTAGNPKLGSFLQLPRDHEELKTCFVDISFGEKSGFDEGFKYYDVETTLRKNGIQDILDGGKRIGPFCSTNQAKEIELKVVDISTKNGWLHFYTEVSN